MDASARLWDRRVATSAASCFGVGLVPVLAYVAFWEWITPPFYLFVILGTYLLLGGFAVLQMLRAAKMDRWSRRVGALGVVVGFAATIFLGLRPRQACLEPAMGTCLSGLTPHPLQLTLGMLVVTASLYLDLGSRVTPFVGD
jgi:hypothetical protein